MCGTSRLEHRIAWLVVVALFPVIHGGAGDWPQFRGPDHNGISREKGWTTVWPKNGPSQLWKASLGMGFSSVAVANGRVYSTGNQGDTDTLYCLDTATGEVIWKHSYPSPLGPKYYEGGTSATPTVYGGRVFQFGKYGDLFCLDAAKGTVIWGRQLAKELDLKVPEWGFASSPIVEEGMLILNAGAAGTALDPGTGKVIWTSDKGPAGYSTMVPFHSDGKRCLTFMGQKAMVIVEAAKGTELARVPWETTYDSNIADPVVYGDEIFISSFDRGGATSKFTGGKIVFGWKDWTMHNHFSTSVLLGGHLFGINGQATKSGDLRCVDFKTGEVKWVQPGIGVGSLIAADGKLIILSEKGELIIAEATSESFKPLARAQVLGGKCWISPVLANGRIYCRNAKGDLVCVDVRSKEGGDVRP
jgi:outer membrane protein assembly factor BamB